jgi:beta-mannosidase
MIKQVRNLFDREADNLLDFAKQSQISQAEAKKYFIEKFRIGKPHRSGIIWWNLLDGWPQVSDAVIDWYGCKKLAFKFIQRSQQQLCLMFDEPIDGKLRLFAVQDGGEQHSVSYTVRNAMTGEILLSGSADVSPESSAPIGEIDAIGDLALLAIEWTRDDGVCGKNHFTSKTEHISYADYLSALEKCGFDEFEGF